MLARADPATARCRQDRHLRLHLDPSPRIRRPRLRKARRKDLRSGPDEDATTPRCRSDRDAALGAAVESPPDRDRPGCRRNHPRRPEQTAVGQIDQGRVALFDVDRGEPERLSASRQPVPRARRTGRSRAHGARSPGARRDGHRAPGGYRRRRSRAKRGATRRVEVPAALPRWPRRSGVRPRAPPGAPGSDQRQTFFEHWKRSRQRMAQTERQRHDLAERRGDHVGDQARETEIGRHQSEQSGAHGTIEATVAAMLIRNQRSGRIVTARSGPRAAGR